LYFIHPQLKIIDFYNNKEKEKEKKRRTRLYLFWGEGGIN
jgi:hypothetical protein